MALLLLPCLANAQKAEAQEPSSSPTSERVIQKPRLLTDARVGYPEDQEQDAVVLLKLRIEKDGQVSEALVVSGQEPFSALAQTAAKGWRFSPATVDDEPHSAWIHFTIEFTAPAEEEVQVVETIAAPQSEGAAPDPPEQVLTVQGVRSPARVRVMSDEETSIIPGAEGDPLRALEVMPGTVPVLGSGPFLGLRGASPGMVGYVYDGLELPYLYHLAGGPAVVHPWLVDSAAMYGTGGPARLGRAAGGTIEATAAEPTGQLRAAARVRITDSALGGEIPFDEGRGNVLLAGRYSYTKPLVSMIAPEFSLNFWDYQGRIRYDVSPAGTIELLSLGAGDRSSTIQPDGSRDDLFYGSLQRTALRYIHRGEDGSWHRTGIIYGHDRWDGEPSEVQPYLHSITLRNESRIPFDDRSWFEYGGDLGLRFQTDFYDSGPNGEVASYKRTDFNTAGWFDWIFQATANTTFSVGARLDVYASGDDPFSEPDAVVAPQPRLAITHLLGDWGLLHQSAGVSAQLKSRSQRPPGRMYSVDGGLEHSALVDLGLELFLPQGFTFDATAFQNVYFNVWDVESIAYVIGQPPNLQRGMGKSIGLELSLKRTLAKDLRGYFSYTLTRSLHSIGRISTFATYDRPHVFDLALAYSLGEGWEITTRGQYYSGFPARGDTVEVVLSAPRTTPYYQIDWELTKRWVYPSGRWWGITMGVLNTTLNSEANDKFCTEWFCEEELIGPATIPTFGIEGEL